MEKIIILVIFSTCFIICRGDKSIPYHNNFCGKGSERVRCLITEYCDYAGEPVCLGCSEQCRTLTEDCLRLCPSVYLFAEGLTQQELDKLVKKLVNEGIDIIINPLGEEKESENIEKCNTKVIGLGISLGILLLVVVGCSSFFWIKYRNMKEILKKQEPTITGRGTQETMKHSHEVSLVSNRDSGTETGTQD